MRYPTSLKRLLRPQRLAIAAAAAVVMLFVMAFGWLELTKYARRKIDQTVAKLEKRLGVEIKIGKTKLGLGGAVFEDIVVGADGAVVISRAAAEVGLNPFADDFGQLSSVVIQRARVKAATTALKGPLKDSLEELEGVASPEGKDKARSKAARAALEKAFASLPVDKLLVRGGAFTIVDEKGDTQIAVKGLRLMIDRARSKALFQASQVKTGSGVFERSLEGRFELMPKEDAYRFYLRKRTARNGRGAWSVAGRLAKDLSRLESDLDLQSLPAFLVPAFHAVLGDTPRVSLKGRAKAERKDGVWSFETDLASKGTRITVPLVSTMPLGPMSFDLSVKGRYDGAARQLNVDEMTVSLPEQTGKKAASAARFGLSFEATLPERFTNAEGERDLSAFALAGSLVLAETDCQTLLDGAPQGLLPALKGFKLTGVANATLEFAFDGSRPESVQYDLKDARYGCKVKAEPFDYSPEHLAGPFTLQREVSKDDEPLEISVSPMKKGYTPLVQVSKNVGIAFTTSEDAGFYVHRGIDAFAIDSALRRNLTEKRVAVGGSTITMQTAKNLFLSHERTISRKMQELFLAWHLENVLDKDRILEIYLNIIEFGPGIFGITQASDHFFGKHPFDLTLMESAYLAALLPNPKARYQYFCEGRLTPAFQDIVQGILRRMVSLNRIPYERYYQALASGIDFNAEARTGARECTKKSWAEGAPRTAALQKKDKDRGGELDPRPLKNDGDR